MTSIFPDRFMDEDLICQDKNALKWCNPEVDSMFLTTNTYYLLDKKFDFSRFFNEEWEPRRFYKDGARGGPYTNPNNVSRDNLMGMFVYLGANKEFWLTRKLAKDILFRCSFFPNTHTTTGKKKLLPDLCGLSNWSTILRTLGESSWLILPLLFILDSFTLFKTLFNVAMSSVHPERTSTVYHTLTVLHFGTKAYPTAFSRLSYQIFVRYRKQVPGFPAKNGVLSALKYYSRNSFDPKIDRIAEVLF